MEKGGEKTIFVLRDGRIRQPTPSELIRGEISPEVMEIIVLKEDGTWMNFFPDPLGR